MAATTRLPADSPQFRRLGRHPLLHRVTGRVAFRTRQGCGISIQRHDVQQCERRHAALIGSLADELKAFRGRQMRQQHQARRPGFVEEPHCRPGQAHDRVQPVIHAHPIPDPQRCPCPWAPAHPSLRPRHRRGIRQGSRQTRCQPSQPEQVEHRRQHRDRITEQRSLCHQRRRRREQGQRPGREPVIGPVPWMPVSRRPADVHHPQRIHLADDAVSPPHRLTSRPRRCELGRRSCVDPVQRPAVHHQPPPVLEPSEVARSVRDPLAPLVLPEQPQRLRQQPHHRRREVEQHRVIPLQPGLEPHVPNGRRRPIQPREMPLPAI